MLGIIFKGSLILGGIRAKFYDITTTFFNNKRKSRIKNLPNFRHFLPFILFDL